MQTIKKIWDQSPALVLTSYTGTKWLLEAIGYGYSYECLAPNGFTHMYVWFYQNERVKQPQYKESIQEKCNKLRPEITWSQIPLYLTPTPFSILASEPSIFSPTRMEVTLSPKTIGLQIYLVERPTV